jgi:NCAIR mutase (PurE)-related protein
VNHRELRALLEGVREGSAGIDEAIERLSALPYEDLGFAHVDHHRGLRRGHGEAIFCAGKTAAQVVEISQRMVAYGHTNVLATRADAVTLDELERTVPVRLYRDLGLAVVNPAPVESSGLVCVCTAGTSDIPVAEEAALTAECLGSHVERVYDVGVAGIHRLFAHMDLLRRARVIIAVAGMEGALASVIGGLVSCPVIAVPTSIGYGASLGGIAALLSMLNSCAPGVAVVNIDNGFGAGYLANLVNQMVAEVPGAGPDADCDSPGAPGGAQSGESQAEVDGP